MQAYLIDPFAKTVTSVAFSGDFKEIYKWIDADCFDAARFNDRDDAVFVDDEGLISGKKQEFFIINGYDQPIAGKGLVLGCDAMGESCAPTVTMKWLMNNIGFVIAFSPDCDAAICALPYRPEAPPQQDAHCVMRTGYRIKDWCSV